MVWDISRPKTIIWLPSRILNTATRPRRSDSQAHMIRPTPLQTELTAISVAPYSASTAGEIDGSARPHTS